MLSKTTSLQPEKLVWSFNNSMIGNSLFYSLFSVVYYCSFPKMSIYFFCFGSSRNVWLFALSYCLKNNNKPNPPLPPPPRFTGDWKFAVIFPDLPGCATAWPNLYALDRASFRLLCSCCSTTVVVRRESLSFFSFWDIGVPIISWAAKWCCRQGPTPLFPASEVHPQSSWAWGQRCWAKNPCGEQSQWLGKTITG